MEQIQIGGQVRLVAVAILALAPLVVPGAEDNQETRASNGVHETSSEARAPASAPSGSAQPGRAVSRDAAKTNVWARWALSSDQDAEKLLTALPDLSQITHLQIEPVRIASIPDELLRQVALHGQNLESLSIAVWGSSPTRQHPIISEVGLESISRLRNLKQLGLACRFSGDGFAHLSNLTRLETLGLNYPTLTSAQFFQVVSKLPSIRVVMVSYADFSAPIDDATFRAIASLNGRLEWLDFSEWGETTIHVSMIPAIAEIESLHWLEVGNFTARYEDFDSIRKSLLYLDHLGPTVHELEDIPTTGNCMWTPATPVQSSKARSVADMYCLFREILGTLPAKAVRKGVVRHHVRAAPEQPDFTTASVPLAEILQRSFGVELKPESQEVFTAISRENPELDQQIRRYLSGMDLIPSK